jgi:predicted Zn-dependent protease
MKKLALASLLLLSPVLVAADRRFDEAIGLYERGEYTRALRILSAPNPATDASGARRLWLGKIQLKLRNWDEAVRELELAVRIEPANAVFHQWLARAYGAKASHVSIFRAFGWARKVGREFEAAARLAPKDANIRFDLLQFYLQAPGLVGGGRDKAENEAGAIAAIEPRLGHEARSIIHRHDKKWDLAHGELMRAVEKYPQVPSVYGKLASFLLERGDFGAAEDYARRALRLKGAAPHARLIVAAAQIELGKEIEPAIEVLNTLTAGPLGDEDPDFAEVYYWLGRAHMAVGDRPNARQAFMAALAFDPEFESAKSALARLPSP